VEIALSSPDLSSELLLSKIDAFTTSKPSSGSLGGIFTVRATTARTKNKHLRGGANVLYAHGDAASSCRNEVPQRTISASVVDSKSSRNKSIHTGCGFMMFIAFRVFLSTEREKLVVAPDLIEKERRRFLTMVLDRGYVGVQLKDDGRSVRIKSGLSCPAKDVKNASKQTEHADISLST